MAHFGAGETIIEEGTRVGALYTVLSGHVQMSVTGTSGQRHEVLRLGAGELFGGVALLRAQLSPCTFSALDDVNVVALHSDAVTSLVARRPSFAREMERLIEARSEAERVVRAGLLEPEEEVTP